MALCLLLLVWVSPASATNDSFGYTFNAADQLASATMNSQPLADFTYDGDGLRVNKTAGGQTVAYIRDAAGNVIAEYAGTTLLAEYVYVNGQRICKLAGGARTYYHSDQVGTPLVITDGSGAATFNGEYRPFGEEHLAEGEGDVHRFTGKELDDELGIYYFHARYYDARIGRFISIDPVGGDPGTPQSWNRYAYVLNNPLKYIDPSGEMWFQSTDTGWQYLEGVDQLNVPLPTGGSVTVPGIPELATFNGSVLTLHQTSGETVSFGARAGKLDAQGNSQPALQNVPDVGPIPEGTWSFNPKETQRYSDLSGWDKAKSTFGGSAWPGGESSWGEERAWLSPETYKGPRSNFSIHGGSAYGSKGCIDLSFSGPAFFGAINRNLDYIPVFVAYP